MNILIKMILAILAIVILLLFLFVVIPPVLIDTLYILTKIPDYFQLKSIFDLMNVDVSNNPASNKVRPYEFMNIAVNVLVAIGTIAVAILTIWGDWIKSRLFHPQLKLICIENEDLSKYDYIHENGEKIFFYHLKVVNTGGANATNCRVLLRELHEKEQEVFKKFTLSVPPAFTWAPLKNTQNITTVFRKQSETLAFCRVPVRDNKNERKLHIVLDSQQYFQGLLDIGKTYRLGLEIFCDNWVQSPSHLQFFEVSWDGEWSDEPKELFGKHFIVKDVTDEVIEKSVGWKRICKMICGQGC